METRQMLLASRYKAERRSRAPSTRTLEKWRGRASRRVALESRHDDAEKRAENRGSESLVEVLRSIGVAVEWSDHTLTLTPPDTLTLGGYRRAAATRTRSILMFIGPLLHRFDAFDIPQVGRMHARAALRASASLGAREIRRLDRSAHRPSSCEHKKLTVAEVVLYESSDTATINALLRAARHSGRERHQIRFRQLPGAGGLRIPECARGRRRWHRHDDAYGARRRRVDTNITYAVAEDPTDAMFFIAAAATTHSALTITRAPIEFLEVELSVLEQMGLAFTVTPTGVAENGITKLATSRSRLRHSPPFPEKIHARPYPGLNIDNLPFFAVIATQAEGTTMIHDWVYEKRAIYYTELDRFGADTLLLTRTAYRSPARGTCAAPSSCARRRSGPRPSSSSPRSLQRAAPCSGTSTASIADTKTWSPASPLSGHISKQLAGRLDSWYRVYGPSSARCFEGRLAFCSPCSREPHHHRRCT
jgi:hypothetical protein